MLRTTTRSANALLVTTLVTVATLSIIVGLTQQLQAGYTLSEVDLAKQQARAASEAVASMMESRLTDIVATNDLAELQRNPDTGLQDDPWEGVQWFGDCIVRWRVEPMIVENEDGTMWSANPLANSQDFDSVSAAQPTSAYTANQNLYHFRIAAEAYALEDNQVVDGTSLQDLEDAGRLPWQDPSLRKAMVQTARVIQIRLSTLFRYAIFYAPVGSDGDLEIHPGPDMDIAGDVHSNGTIFWRNLGDVSISGAEAGEDVSVVGVGGIFMFHKPWFYRDKGPTSDPYAATDYELFDSNNQQINGIPIDSANDSRNPAEMRASFGSNVRDGNMGATVVRTLANIPELAGRPFELQRYVTPGTTLWTTNPATPSDQTAWTIIPNNPPAPFYQDPGMNNFDFTDIADSNAVAVTTWAKRLYYQGDFTDFDDYPLPITVDNDSDGFLDSDGTTPVADARIVTAEGLRRFYQRNADGSPVYEVIVGGSIDGQIAADIEDIYDPLGYLPREAWNDTEGDWVDTTGGVILGGQAGWHPNLPPAVDGNGDGLSDNMRLGVYADWAINGKDNEGTYGLSIIERPTQRLFAPEDTWTGMPNRPNQGFYATDSAYPAFADMAQAKEYANYLKSQYIVLFGPWDITDVFFDYNINAATNPSELVAFEDDVFDRREASWAQYFLLSRVGAYTNSGTPITSKSDSPDEENWWRTNYRNNTLTLNLELVNEFIRTYDGIDPETGIADTNFPVAPIFPVDVATAPLSVTGTSQLSDRFSGLIYAVRTRRSPGITPALPEWHIENLENWRLESNINIVAPQFDERTFGGPHEIYHSAIRLWNGADINHGALYVDDQGTPSNTADDYTRRLGLTVITPGLMYGWGDYNIVETPDSNGENQLPPCALFSDRMVFKSNSWRDEEQVWDNWSLASNTTLNASLILNYTPTHQQPGENRYREGGGVHNAVLFLENWGGGRTYSYRGSLVVMNTRRYGYSLIGAAAYDATLGLRYYSPPTRDVSMNTDLFERPGQPPFSPFGVQIIRTANYMFDEF